MDTNGHESVEFKKFRSEIIIRRNKSEYVLEWLDYFLKFVPDKNIEDKDTKLLFFILKELVHLIFWYIYFLFVDLQKADI